MVLYLNEKSEALKRKFERFYFRKIYKKANSAALGDQREQGGHDVG